MSIKTTFLLAVLLALPSLPLHAQISDTILPNPHAVLLRKIWMIQGEAIGPNATTRVGDAAGSLFDVNQDSIQDFLVHVGKQSQWRLYLGAKPQPDTALVWTTIVAAPIPSYPVIGDFFGDGRRLVGFGQERFWDHPPNYRMYFYRLTSDSLPAQPLLIYDAEGQPTTTEGFGVDLDGDSADELITVLPVLLHDNQRSTNAEIWFYKGGPDFQVEQPTKIIVDEDENDDHAYSTAFADVDGDHYVDMVIGCGYPSGPKLKIWYGREGSPWNWTSTPDRVIALDTSIGINTPLTYADYDGDGKLDFAGRVFQVHNPGVFVYLSGSGKSFRSRSFSRDDAEVYFRTSQYGPLGSVGYLNDPQRKQEMLPLYGPKPRPLLFSATKDGIDPYFEAYFAGGLEETMAWFHRVPLRDCNGDGWDDFLSTDPKWGGFDQGIAIILAGGPYIPHDDPTVDVQELPAEGKSNAISIWPNPVCDRLNIAWHGRLQHSPARMTIHDLTGRLVASGATDGAVGAMQWNAAEIASGCYRLTVYDADGGMIASTQFIKQP